LHNRIPLTLAVLVVLGAAALAAALLAVRGNGRTLEIRDTASGKLFGRWPVKEKGEFAVEFIHSVNQSPVRETFRIEEGMIKPVAVRFFSFGAGVASDLEEGQTLSRDGDAMIIDGFNAFYKELNYIVGTVSDHILFINGEEVSMRKLCGRNAHITFSVR
jgi:hypothetical protein